MTREEGIEWLRERGHPAQWIQFRGGSIAVPFGAPTDGGDGLLVYPGAVHVVATAAGWQLIVHWSPGHDEMHADLESAVRAADAWARRLGDEHREQSDTGEVT